jgi:hypothetical protein
MTLYALIKANTMANGTGGEIYHAFYYDAREGIGPALCGSKPGRRGYWSSYLGKKVTCHKCLKKMALEPNEVTP